MVRLIAVITVPFSATYAVRHLYIARTSDADVVTYVVSVVTAITAIITATLTPDVEETKNMIVAGQMKCESIIRHRSCHIPPSLPQQQQQQQENEEKGLPLKGKGNWPGEGAPLLLVIGQIGNR